MKSLHHVLAALLSAFALSCQGADDGVDNQPSGAGEAELVTRAAVELPKIDFTTIRINSETLNYDKNKGASLQRGGGGLAGNVTANFYRDNIQVRMTYGPLPASVDGTKCTFYARRAPDAPGHGQKFEYFTPLIESFIQITALSFNPTTRLVTGTFPWFGGDFLGALWAVEGACTNNQGDVIQRTSGGQFFIKGARGCGSRGVGTSWCGQFNPGGTCWCDSSCQNLGDCCEDYQYACTRD